MHLPRRSSLVYFIDFDGTITKVDTCQAMVKAFARNGWQEYERKWEKGEISTEECARSIFASFRATEQELIDFLSSIEIDTTFLDFVSYCSLREERLYILSDGYDLNINIVLQKYGLSEIPFYSNCLKVTAKGFDIMCRYQNPACLQCGTCKRLLVNQLNRDKKKIVYIGDGTSDLCVAKAADLLFAKDKLLAYCRTNGVEAIPYRNFADIISCLKADDERIIRGSNKSRTF